MRIRELLILNFLVCLQFGCERQEFDTVRTNVKPSVTPAAYPGQVPDCCDSHIQPEESDRTELTDAAIHQTDQSRISIYVRPFYDSNGPQVNIGQYSTELAEATSDSAIGLVARMKKDWSILSIELMYVTSIRLFDLGLKDDAIYWFYSAQFRARLFASVAQTDPNDRIGSATSERLQAHDAFYELAGPAINRYAFSNLAMLQDKIRLAKSDVRQIPRFKSIYPMQEFIADRLWPDANNEIAKGLDDFLRYITDNAQQFEEIREDGEAVAVRKFFSREANVNAQFVNGKTQLHIAIEVRDKEAYRRLLANGANPDICNAVGASVVHLAAQQPDGFWLREAIKHGGNPNQPNAGNSFSPNDTPIFYAIDKKRSENVLALIASGADVNHVDDNHETPLYRCMGVGLYSLMMKLLDAGADPTPPEPAFSIFENGWFSENYEKTLDTENEKRDYFALKAKLIDSGQLKAIKK